jgi:hypothetical protein
LARILRRRSILRISAHRQVEFTAAAFLSDARRSRDLGRAPLGLPFRGCQGWAHHPIPDKGERDGGRASTLQKEYLHILLLDLMNGGQFSPTTPSGSAAGFPLDPRGSRADFAEASPRPIISSWISTAPKG